jgi:hypothetical protein
MDTTAVGTTTNDSEGLRQASAVEGPAEGDPDGKEGGGKPAASVPAGSSSAGEWPRLVVVFVTVRRVSKFHGVRVWCVCVCVCARKYGF